VRSALAIVELVDAEVRVAVNTGEALVRVAPVSDLSQGTVVGEGCAVGATRSAALTGQEANARRLSAGVETQCLRGFPLMREPQTECTVVVMNMAKRGDCIVRRRVLARRWAGAGLGLGVAVALAIPATAVAALTGDWGQAGGGPAHSGNVVSETTITTANAADLHVVWSHDFGGEPYDADGVSSPAVVDGRVFVTVSASSQLWAFRASDGTPLWHRSVGSAGYPSPPAVGRGRVFVQSSQHLRVFDARTGERLWTRINGGGSDEPVLANGLVYVASGGVSCCTGLAAYTARTGRLVWRRSIRGVGSMRSPAVVNGVAYTASITNRVSNTRRDYTLWAFDAFSGRTRWQRHPPLNGSEIPNGVVATPSVANGVIYDGGLDAYSTAGQLLWVNNQRGGGSNVTPTVGAGLVFNELGAFDQNGGECAYRVDSGSIVWCAGDSIYDSSTLANSVLFVEDGCDCLTALDAKTGTQLYYDGRHRNTGQPVISRGTVYTGGPFRLSAYRP
jgi:outer membrane protein assembly factor BamB